jgi:hypothetical protein
MFKSTTAEHNAAEQARHMGAVRNGLATPVHRGEPTGVMFDRFITTVGRTAEDFDQQASEVRKRSISMAKETLANSMDFAHRALNLRQPHELTKQGARGKHCSRGASDGKVRIARIEGSLAHGIGSRLMPDPKNCCAATIFGYGIAVITREKSASVLSSHVGCDPSSRS